MNARQKRMRWMIFILFLLAVLAILLSPREIGNAQGFNSGYPTAWGYPPPVPTAWDYPAPTIEPWCEEAMLLGMSLPWWCKPVIGEAVVTVATEPEEAETPTPAAMKTGGRAKGRQ